MNKSVIIAAILALGAGSWILSGQLGSTNEPAPSTPFAQTPSAEKTMSVRVRDLVALPLVHKVTITGETQASRRVDLRAETEGQVERIFAERGDVVHEGDPLAQLRLDDRNARLAEYEARLRQRLVEYDAAKELNDKGYRSTTNLAAAAAELDAARAVVRQAEIDIERTRLRAPFDGIVGEGHVEVGNYVKVGDIAATIVDLDPILIVGHITEREVGQLSMGAAGTITLVDHRTLQGRVTFVSPIADPATRTYRFELSVENPDFSIRDGVTARIVVPGRQSMAHFVSPAILTLNNEGVVGIKSVDKEDVVRFLPVEILGDTPEGIWLGGLPESIRAIVVGQEFVVDGETVIPVLADNAAATARRDRDLS